MKPLLGFRSDSRRDTDNNLLQDQVSVAAVPLLDRGSVAVLVGSTQQAYMGA